MPSQVAGLRVLEIASAGRRFGLEVAAIQGIEHPSRWARLPGAPAYVSGVVEVWERVLAVVDLECRLGLSPTPQLATARPVAVIDSEEPVALAVERVVGVTSLDPRELIGSPELVSAGVQGISSSGLIVLEPEALVDGRQLRPLTSVLGEAE